jgi:hypothetical protein
MDVVQRGIERRAAERLREFQTRGVPLLDSRVWKLWMMSKSTEGSVAGMDVSLAESASANPKEKSVSLCLIACSSYFFQFGKNPRVELLDPRMISISQSSCSCSLKTGPTGHHLMSMSGLKSSGRSRPSFLATFLDLFQHRFLLGFEISFERSGHQPLQLGRPVEERVDLVPDAETHVPKAAIRDISELVEITRAGCCEDGANDA